MSTRGFGFSKIHTSLLYLTGNYMEMWHNGEQARGVTTAMAGEGGGTVSEGFITSEHAHIPPSSPAALKQCALAYIHIWACPCGWGLCCQDHLWTLA